MVGRRQWNADQGGRHRGSHIGQDARPQYEDGPRDLENGRYYDYGIGNKDSRPKPRIMKFQDAARTALEDARRGEIKRALMHGIDRSGLEKYRKSDEELKKMKNKKLRHFYEQQNERLNDWLEVDAVVMAIADDVLESMNPDPDHDGDQERCGGIQRVEGNIGELLPDEEKEKRRKAAKRANWAININVMANILLLAGKTFAVFTTGSLSLVASLVDSALDLLCTLIVWSTSRLVLWRLHAMQRRFPVGKRRLEPLGILVFSIIMVISFLQILQESVSRLMPPHAEAEILSWTAIASLLATIILKGAIGLGCRPIQSSQVQALVQDCFENVVRLSGEAADDHTLKKLIYLAYRFAPVVTGFKNVTAYHAGDGVWVEFDVLLDEKTPLNRSHDIAETLQYCAEGLGEVDRAFVTTDYAVLGPLGHATDSEWNH